MSSDTKTTDGGQAFAANGYTGMSLRDWFAGQTIVSSAYQTNVRDGGALEALAERAYMVADAMLAERGKAQ